MARAIDAAMIEARLRDLAAVSVNQTVSLFKGGTFALAAVMLIEIAFTPDDRITRLILWASTVFMVMTSYNAWLNSTVTLFREGVGNVVAMVAQGMVELMLFAVLTPRPVAGAWRYWIVVAAVFFIITGARLATPMNKGASVDPDVQPLFDLVQRSRTVTSRAVLTTAVLAALLAIPTIALPETSPWPRRLCLALAAFNIVHATIAMFQQQRERDAMDEMLDAAAQSGAQR